MKSKLQFLAGCVIVLLLAGGSVYAMISAKLPVTTVYF